MALGGGSAPRGRASGDGCARRCTGPSAAAWHRGLMCRAGRDVWVRHGRAPRGAVSEPPPAPGGTGMGPKGGIGTQQSGSGRPPWRRCAASGSLPLPCTAALWVKGEGGRGRGRGEGEGAWLSECLMFFFFAKGAHGNVTEELLLLRIVALPPVPCRAKVSIQRRYPSVGHGARV